MTFPKQKKNFLKILNGSAPPPLWNSVAIFATLFFTVSSSVFPFTFTECLLCSWHDDKLMKRQILSQGPHIPMDLDLQNVCPQMGSRCAKGPGNRE